MTAAVLLERMMRLAGQTGQTVVLKLYPDNAQADRWLLVVGDSSAVGDAADGGDLENQIIAAVLDVEEGTL